MFFGSDGVKYKPIADKDREVIPVQLGREARGVLGISRRCAYGFPQVIVNRPVTLEIADITVFPTLFWLTCPYLRKAVSRLESEGWISRFEERLETDPAFAEQVADDHATHAETRLSLIPREVQARLAEDYPEFFRVVAHSGVGGSRSREGVKCLHMHLADFFARGRNAIGEEVLRLLDCPLDCASGSCEEEL